MEIYRIYQYKRGRETFVTPDWQTACTRTDVEDIGIIEIEIDDENT